MHVFISYNQADAEIAVALATQLRLVGTDVWLDAWEIKPGDSIPGRVNQALEYVDTVVVVWSASASASRWVGAELEAALARGAGDQLRAIPVALDDTPLPPLLSSLKWVGVEDAEGADEAAREIAGIDSDADFLRAVQVTLESARLEVGYFEGYGPAVACSRCGAPLSELEGWSQVDERRDDTYAGVRCKRCGWSDGGEIW